MIYLNRLSTEYVQVQVTFTVSGVPQNPTNDVVQMAFTADGTLPGSGDWKSASWETAPSGYFAQCLVGPANSGVVLAPGVYDVWVKVTDSPEVPVRSPASLTIT